MSSLSVDRSFSANLAPAWSSPPIPVEVYGEGATPLLRDRVHRRVLRAVRPFRRLLGRVVVRISDCNGDRGGVDQMCRIEATVVRRGVLVVEAVQAGRGAALAKAIGRLERALRRRIDSERFHRRDRSRRVRTAAAAAA